jgi:flagellar hook protein FlgE
VERWKQGRVAKQNLVDKLGGIYMLRSLYSGVSGMKVNQVKMDVIGNNIANVGTTAFKSGRTRFQDMLSQSNKSALSPMTNSGGINPSQVGLGVQLAGIDTLTKQGMMQPTGNSLDVAVDGEGYFVVGNGPTVWDPATIVVDNAAAESTHTVATYGAITPMVTRDGSFTRDFNGDLLTSDGYRVMGYLVKDDANTSIATDGSGKFIDVNSTPPPTTVDTGLCTLRIPDTVDDAGVARRVVTFAIGKDGMITGVLDNGKVTAIGQLATVSFKNPAGLTKMGKNVYMPSSNSGTETYRVGAYNTTCNNEKGYGDITQGMLEMSNVDLAEQFTDMIVTSRAFQASGKMITTGDEMLQDIINLKR